MIRVSVVLAALVVLLGAGCNRDAEPPATPTPAGGEDPGSSFAGLTPEAMADVLHNQLNFEASRDPDKMALAQISFEQPIAADQFVTLIKNHRIAVTDQIEYAYGAKGGGWARVPQGVDLSAFLAQLYRQKLDGLTAAIASTAQLCTTRPDEPECQPVMRRDDTHDSLRILREQGQLHIAAAGVRGRQADLFQAWQSTSTIFAIQLEPADFIYGPALYPTTEMQSWF